MNKAASVAAVLCVTLASCAGELVWTKPGMNEAEFRRDAYECERDARMLPPAAAA